MYTANLIALQKLRQQGLSRANEASRRLPAPRVGCHWPLLGRAVPAGRKYSTVYDVTGAGCYLAIPGPQDPQAWLPRPQNRLQTCVGPPSPVAAGMWAWGAAGKHTAWV